MEEENDHPNPSNEEIESFLDRVNSSIPERTPEEKQSDDLKSAYQHLDNLLDNNAPFGEGVIKELHEIISANMEIPLYKVGSYDLKPKTIKGMPWLVKPFAHPDNIKKGMKKLGREFESSMRFHPEDPNQLPRVVTNAAEVMVELIDIHPFRDGNGRVSRLCADAILLSGGLSQMPHWLNHKTNDTRDKRFEFFKMMEDARNGNPQDLVVFMTKEQIGALEKEISTMEPLAEGRENANNYIEEQRAKLTALRENLVTLEAVSPS